jgi:hypothetical protein
VRGKLRAALAKRRPDLVLPEAAWRKPWVVDCTTWGEGDEAVLRYLARYVFRIAITNSRIVGLDDKGVTIRHKDRKSMQWRTTRLSGQEFMRRFLQHVLPKGLHKVRYFGLWHSARRDHAARAQLMLRLDRSAAPGRDARPTETAEQTTATSAADDRQLQPRICPCCKERHLVRVAWLYPRQTRGP